MFALADCNNFFVSCERVFRPELNGRPVIVLSSNDGCVIARSNEAKAIGIKMGEPLFKIKDIVKRHDVTIFSSNMALYADFSRRIRMILRQAAPHIEVYSIDEAFLDLRGMCNDDFDSFAKTLSLQCRRLTGIPVSVGVAPTKTLAKVAAELCKHYPKLRGGCFMHREEDIIKVLKKTPIEDVWGIGRRSTPRLHAKGIDTAYDFRSLPKEWVQRVMGTPGVRTWQELNGIPSIGFEAVAGSKQSICNSRSFAKEIYDIKELSEQVAKFAVMTAEKLRQQKSVCQRLTVFAATNRFHDAQAYQYGHIALPFIEPTDSSLEIVRTAREALNEIYVRGIGYKRAGVIASEITPRDGLHVSMFSAEHNERHHRLMKTIDSINNLVGCDAVTLASAGKGAPLNRSDYRSPRYTTSWSDIPVIK